MIGRHHVDLDAPTERLRCAAPIHGNDVVLLHETQRDKISCKLVIGEDLGARQTGQIKEIGYVILVAVRHQDQVHFSNRLQVPVLRRRLRISGEERINHDHFAGDARDAGRCVPKPKHFDGLGCGKAGDDKQKEAQDERPLGFHKKLRAFASAFVITLSRCSTEPRTILSQ